MKLGPLQRAFLDSDIAIDADDLSDGLFFKQNQQFLAFLSKINNFQQMAEFSL